MQESISRRHFLRLSALVSTGFSGLQLFACAPVSNSPAENKKFVKGYGHLTVDPEKKINLPKGFSYQIISEYGQLMDDGFLLPGKPDGMATFAEPNGKTIIVRNHEISPEWFDKGPFGKDHVLLNKIPREMVYDYGQGELPCLGGTTTMVFDTRTQKLEKQFLSLTGTIRNCAGGPTPWQTWITCEETVAKAEGRLEKDHGYNFEVPATTEIGITPPVPLKSMGRFQHEAVAVDPKTNIIYQTEDRMDGAIYRFIPNQAGDLQKGGKLQILGIKDHPKYDTRNWKKLKTAPFPIQKPMEVVWYDLDDVEAPEDDLRYRGFEMGGARFARGEGMWFGKGECFFTCTNGGKKMQGQIFRYLPSPYEGTERESEEPGTLSLFVESTHTKMVRDCDNITMSPVGDLIVCEDNETPRIAGITPEGAMYTIAQNVGFRSEFAGATFSPDGTTLFVNVQHAGLTLAITGPWKDRNV